jgi:serine phosphatase RsbU (regulator of sigma subunit)
LFSIGFALAVVFVFEPLHRRVQGVVDRVFYRQQYDYRKTIRSLSEAMTSIFDAKVIASTLIGSVVREMFLETGALFLRASSGGYQLNVAEVADTASTRLRDIGPEDALLQALKAKNDVILRHDFALNPIYEAERHILEDQMQALSAELLVPMRYKDELVGILPLGRKKSGKMFTPEDLDLLRTLTNQSAIALENARLFRENLEKGRIEEELRIAHSIQLSMLPEHPPELEGLRIAARSISAREVGGDFYDFVEFNGDGTCSRLGVVVGDVSGKGVSGALLMAASRSTYRVLSEARSSAAEVMGLANERLRRDIKKGMFVALLYAIIDPRQKTLTLSNAGQTQPVMCRIGESSPRYLETEGDTFPLGIVPECDYRETEIALRAGDVVVFYTDGVVEAMNAKSELYGFDRLMAAISSARDLGADELLQSVIDDVTRFVGGVEQHDDLTIVVAKVE